jgi:uncharacterized glyoxalase superfamily protein PhnB
VSRRPSPIPEEFHTITPHLVVRGLSKAVDFYARAFGAHEFYRSTTPDGKTVTHCELLLGDSRFFLVDEMPDWGVVSPLVLGGSPVTLHLYVADADLAYARAIEAGAEMVMPPNEGFWGERYGIVRDPSGHLWALASRTEDLAPGEVKRRAAAALSAFDTKPPAERPGRKAKPSRPRKRKNP